ncbi:MAG: DUF1674 domain-containing protein [Steroidobacteraceae bacterium]
MTEQATHPHRPPNGGESAVSPPANALNSGDSAANSNDAPGLGDRPVAQTLARPREIGGRLGPDPTRFGDWELRGRCIDF